MLAVVQRTQRWWETWNTELPYLLFQNTVNSAGVVMAETCSDPTVNNPDLFTGMEDYDSVLRMVGAGHTGLIPTAPLRVSDQDPSMMRAFNRENRTLMTERISAAVPEPWPTTRCRWQACSMPTARVGPANLTVSPHRSP